MPTMNRPTSNNLPPGVAVWMIPGEEPRGMFGDTCGNCKEPWPCCCDDPVRICGICGGDDYDCRCDERSNYGEPA